jgi:dihydropteroate synthase
MEDHIISREFLQPVRQISCRDLILELGHRTLLMGIVNITPDSFSDGGETETVEAAVRKVHGMIEAGADIIDIGGESTRPGANKVSLEEELGRIIPVVKALKKASIQIPISIDTYKSEVAKQTLEAGAHIINDVWGLKQDPQMASVISSYACPIILTHNRKKKRVYNNVVEEVISDLRESIQMAHEAGIEDDQIIVDPGIGFAKTLEDNLQLMKHLSAIVSLGYPVVLGTSRKSMIQKTLGLPADEVLEGTAVTVALGIAQGCQIMRVHDVSEMKKVLLMSDAIMNQS